MSIMYQTAVPELDKFQFLSLLCKSNRYKESLPQNKLKTQLLTISRAKVPIC